MPGNRLVISLQTFDVGAFDGDFTVMLDFTTANVQVMPPSRLIKLEFIDKMGSYYGFRFDLIGKPPGKVTHIRA